MKISELKTGAESKDLFFNNLRKALINSLDDSLSYKGLSIELSSNILKSETSNFLKIDEELEKKNIRIYTEGLDMDKHMLLYTILKMLENRELDLNLNKKTTEKNKNYLKKLSDCILLDSPSFEDTEE